MTDKSPQGYLLDLLAAQKMIEGVDKDGKNPFFKSDYTTLNATIIACKEVLNKYNFVLLQPIESDENGVYVCTKLVHISGQEITSRMRIEQAKSNDPQAQGSAITYARRYALKSLLGMYDQDDDAEVAMSRSTTPAPKPAYVKPAYSSTAPTAMCAVHKVSMKQFEKNGKKWFSHKADDGTWCNGAPPKKVQPLAEDDFEYFVASEAAAVADDINF